MGIVFPHQQMAVGKRPVALKVLCRNRLDDPDFLRRFAGEASSAGRISHQNVATIYECGQTAEDAPTSQAS